MKKTIETMLISLVIGTLFAAFAVAKKSGAFMSDEEYIDAHPEIYRPDGNWREDWAKYLEHPEVYSGHCLHEWIKNVGSNAHFIQSSHYKKSCWKDFQNGL